MKNFLLLTLALFAPFPASAVILYDQGNDANTTAPGTGPALGLPFSSVAKLAGGSAVYLGHGYMLTADHVAVNGDTSVTFDNASTYTIDTTFAAVQVASKVDLKIFKINGRPDVPAVNLFAGDPAEQVRDQTSYFVGWGLGRAPGAALNTGSVAWGDGSTRAHRWGEMVITESGQRTHGNYTFSSLWGHATANPNSAALTLYDSGGGLFTQIDNVWYLSAIAVAVDTNGNSAFGNGTLPGSGQYFVSIAAYQDEILAIIPEPAWGATSGGAVALGLLFFRTRQRRSPRHAAKAA